MFRLASPVGLVRSTLLASAAVFVSPFSAEAQSERSKPSAGDRHRAGTETRRKRPSAPQRGADRTHRPAGALLRRRRTAGDQGQGGRGALAVLSAQQALTEINNTPGGVAIVPAAAYRNSTVANTIKDILDYVPGVFAQPKWGDDTRLSIRGSGLSRNFHLRGVQLYMDGIPINTADGYGDFQEIDPTAYKYVEVYKGANALQFGANSLGGAINFVMPTGRDPFPNGASVDFGAFGFKRLQANAGGANGPWDGFVTAATQASDGFRDHSFGSATRVSGNVGYQFSPDAETRFYFNANEVRQRIPGGVTKQSALTNPEAAAPSNVANDWQRNIDTVRLANKTTIRFDDTKVEFGAFGVDRHLMHPIFQWLDYSYKDYGGFAKVTDDRFIGGFRNRLVAGVNILNGSIDNQQFANLGGQKGALLSSSIDRSKNTSLYVEDSFYFLPNVAAIAGTQFLYATRNRQDRFLSEWRCIRARPSSGSGRRRPACSGMSIRPGRCSATSRAAPRCRASAKASNGPGIPFIPFTSIRPQIATTYEIGTRMKRPDYAWELTAYRANIRDELQCLYSAFGNCNVTNADRTIHQGIEAGAGAAIFRGIFDNGPAPDKLWLNLAYTFNDFRFDNDPTFGNNLLPGAPRHYLRAELLYKNPTGFYFGPNVEWVPQAYFVDSANTLKTEAYALLGLKAGFDNGGPISAYIEGRNLTNKAYISSASIINQATATSPLFEPGNGRAVFAGMKYRW